MMNYKNSFVITEHVELKTNIFVRTHSVENPGELQTQMTEGKKGFDKIKSMGIRKQQPPSYSLHFARNSLVENKPQKNENPMELFLEQSQQVLPVASDYSDELIQNDESDDYETIDFCLDDSFVDECEFDYIRCSTPGLDLC